MATAERALDPADLRELVIAGWTGRDAARVEAHVRELEAEGIPRPPRTPMFYLLAASLLTTSDELTVIGASTSGEVECLLVSRADGVWVGLGSDHTDPPCGRSSVCEAKPLFAKPVARTFWRCSDFVAHWVRLELRSFIEAGGKRVPYQDGTAAAMLAPDALLKELAARGGAFVHGTAIFCGTLATLSAIRPSSRFEMELHDPVLGRTIRHAYRVLERPESL